MLTLSSLELTAIPDGGIRELSVSGNIGKTGVFVFELTADPTQKTPPSPWSPCKKSAAVLKNFVSWWLEFHFSITSDILLFFFMSIKFDLSHFFLFFRRDRFTIVDTKILTLGLVALLSLTLSAISDSVPQTSTLTSLSMYDSSVTLNFVRMLLLCLLLPGLALAEKGPWRIELKPVKITDPAMPVLNQWQAKITGRYRKDGHTQPRFGSWLEIPSEPLHRLFPELRFITIHWDELAAQSADEFISRAAGLYVILAIDSTKPAAQEAAQEFFGYGDNEGFGVLLARHGITINSSDDATLVWNAFCDLYQRHWKDHGIEKIDDTTWHLGTSTIGGFHYYYRVDLDSSHKVIRGKLHADKVKSQ